MDDIFESIKRFFKNLVRYLDLRYEAEEPEVVYNEIIKGINFIGTNLWILFFAVIVASVGLNVNSTAVIIGAMLISPLMGPINGMGYSLATYNFPLFRRSIKNFSFAVCTGLIASTLYFFISPVSTAHSELLARTFPTIYDVLIAFFGGLAGIVAVSSKIKGNVIPGVAIATALMPPLCTAGYGLANGKMDFFFGAMYLFTINTVFIAVSAVLVSRFLNFPISGDVEPARKAKIKRLITAVILVTMIPSVFFGIKLVKNERFKENAQAFVSKVSILENNYLLDSEINSNLHTIKLVYSSDEFYKDDSIFILQTLQECKIEPNQVNVKIGVLEDAKAKNENIQLKTKLDVVSQVSNEAVLKLNNLRDSLNISKNKGKDIINEISTLYPVIESVAVSESAVYSANKKNDAKNIYLVKINNKGSISNTDKKKIKQWLEVKLNSKNIEVIYN